MEPSIATDAPVERVQLDEDSWVDVVRGWLQGADEVHDQVVAATAWSGERLFRYDHWVESPRLGGSWKRGDPVAHPVLLDGHRWVQHRYKVQFDGFALAQYRDGSDGQAFHRDREMRWLDDTIIGVLSLGATRPWLIRPRSNRYAHEAPSKGATHDLAPGSGDLLVMGGHCQAAWEHSVPQVRGRPVGSRVSLQWRWTSRRGRPESGGNYSEPRTYSRRR